MSPSDPSEISNVPELVEPGGSVRKIGSISGFLMFLFLDLLALDDITTDGAWMPEIMIILCSIPALVTLGYFALKAPEPFRPIEGGGKGEVINFPGPGEHQDG
ncbi:MAG: hypothetical protein ABIF09_12960 [Gemmatimonadota bacterium]